MNTPSVNPNVAWICGTVLLLGILGLIGGLAWHGTLTGTNVLGIVGSIVLIVGSIFGVHAGVNAVTKATATTSTSQKGATDGL